MGRLNFYTTETNYNASKDSFEYPTVSYVEDTDEVRYMEKPHDYSKDYLTFEALEGGTFSIIFTGATGYDDWYITRDMRQSFSYSLDNGDNWTTFMTPNDTYTGTALTTPSVNVGQKILWKGIGKQNLKTGPTPGKCYFTSTGRFNISGNVMSLLYGDDFESQTEFPQNSVYTFSNLFESCIKLVSIENLVLPSLNLVSHCYSSMFSKCSSLTAVPKILPATTLVQGCYFSMFSSCTSLTTATELPATTLANSCYSYMFQNCNTLNYIKAMFTTEPSTTYTSNWVSGVASTGTFVKNSAATWTTTGVNGIPTGWTVQTASE